MRIQIKPWMGRPDGRILVYKKHKVIFSKHFRDLDHAQKIIAAIKNLLDKTVLL